MVFNGTGLVIKLWGPLGTLCSESECRSSVLGLKTTRVSSTDTSCMFEHMRKLYCMVTSLACNNYRFA